MANKTTFDFEANIDGALEDDQLRKNLRKAMDILVDKRRAVFPDAAYLEQLRSAGNAIKRRALQQLPRLLEQLEANCTRNGIQVHWAEDTAQANGIVLDILRRHDAQDIVKGKSMVSEEMHLNRFLEENDIEAIETDLGEFIIQLNHETPSHIIVPAIHKNKDEVAAIFHEKIADTPYTEDVEELTAIARRVLRKRFAAAKVGLSGVNFAIAETGTLLLVENEGNGRMCTTAPEVHVAVMGLEKVIEKLSDVPPLLRLLTGSATGQMITTYVNMITSPRRSGEKDGPKEVHLVLLDNGRSHILADPEFRQTLLCIRLRHLPESLSGLRSNWRPCLRARLSRPHRQDPDPADGGARTDRGAGHRIQPLRRMRRGLPGADPDSGFNPPPAQRKLRSGRQRCGGRRGI
jgi:L-lactate dehydrogenase complex protein LldF